MPSKVHNFFIDDAKRQAPFCCSFHVQDSACKRSEKAERQVIDITQKYDESTRQVTQLVQDKQRVVTENNQLLGDVQEYKKLLESAEYVKTTLARQCEETKRKLEDEERQRSIMQTTISNLEVDIETYRSNLDEEQELRVEIERQLSTAKTEASMYKSKYDAEVIAHADEVEELK